MISRIVTVILLLIIATSAPQALKASEADVADIGTIDSLELRAHRLIDTIKTTLDGNARIDSARFDEMPWYKQLYETGFRIHDPAINYPRFMRFALKVYDWGDHTFNSYNPDYVVGTGKNWKARIDSYNWMESYMMLFSINSRDMLHIRSNVYDDLGIHLSFMALSIGYTAKVNNWAGDESKRSNFNFNFTTSRFSANIDILSTEGASHITHFGDYNDGHSFNYRFNDISHKALSGEFYYFINHLKFSQAAAYCFSKYQLRSAGSPIVGFAFNNQRIAMDFSNLPPEMKQFLPSLENYYNFRFTDYGIIGGYSYNFVLRPKTWLINLTGLPSIGFRHSYSTSSEGKKMMLAANIRARFSVVYNHRALFASLCGRLDGNLFFNAKYTFFNATESLSAIVGVRF